MVSFCLNDTYQTLGKGGHPNVKLSTHSYEKHNGCNHNKEKIERGNWSKQEYTHPWQGDNPTAAHATVTIEGAPIREKISIILWLFVHEESLGIVHRPELSRGILMSDCQDNCVHVHEAEYGEKTIQPIREDGKGPGKRLF